MRTIIHASDFHFGTTRAELLEPFRALVDELAPDLLVVSGDFTQRARRREYEAAQAYLAQLPTPQLLIPGNHDVPLYDVVRRFVSPLGRYRRYITANLAPVFLDDEVAVLGINTARSLTFKGGAIDAHQIDEVVARLATLPAHVARIVVTHHPFDIPVGLSGVKIIKGAARALTAFAPFHVDLYLAGHLHLVHGASAARYVRGYDAPLLVAGTAISTRARGEPNSFFVLRVASDAIVCHTRSWSPATRTFTHTATQRFPRSSGT